MGFCIFNNIAIAALHARTIGNDIKRVAIVDYDVHHGNGTQQALWNDPDALVISIHQDNNYPPNSGSIEENGAHGNVINVPLPPGSGSGAYLYAFEQVVVPALNQFNPDLILVSSGFDASYYDPLGSMMLSSETFRSMSSMLVNAADRLCNGRIVFAHEGGYSESYVPYCGLAVVETLLGVRTSVVDPYLTEIHGAGYQQLQPHQKAVVDAAAALIRGDGETTRVSKGQIADHVDSILDNISSADRVAYAVIEGQLAGMDLEARARVLNLLQAKYNTTAERSG